MTKIVRAAATALSLLLLPVAALAEPGQGNGNGRGMIVLGEDGWRFCPPGLADREPACVPPGQARQAIAEEEREQRRAQRRAERQAARDAAPERTNVTPGREAGRGLAVAEDKADALDAASLIATLLTPRPEASTVASTPAQATSVAETTPLQPARATAEPMLLAEALELAAGTGEVGY